MEMCVYVFVCVEVLQNMGWDITAAGSKNVFNFISALLLYKGEMLKMQQSLAENKMHLEKKKMLWNK